MDAVQILNEARALQLVDKNITLEEAIKLIDSSRQQANARNSIGGILEAMQAFVEYQEELKTLVHESREHLHVFAFIDKSNTLYMIKARSLEAASSPLAQLEDGVTFLGVMSHDQVVSKMKCPLK